MSIRDVYLIACTAAVSVFLTLFVLQKSEEDERIAVTQSLTEKGDPIRQSNQAHITNECDKGQIVAAVGQARTNPPAQARKETQGNSEKSKLDAEIQNKFSRFFDAQKQKNISDLSAQIENRFYEEEWDPNWSEEKESKIHQLFTQNEELENILPLDVSCRSKNCQIVVPAADEAQIHELSTTFMQVATNVDLGMTRQSVSFFSDPGSSSLVFYISDNQHENLLRQ